MDEVWFCNTDMVRYRIRCSRRTAAGVWPAEGGSREGRPGSCLSPEPRAAASNGAGAWRCPARAAGLGPVSELKGRKHHLTVTLDGFVEWKELRDAHLGCCYVFQALKGALNWRRFLTELAFRFFIHNFIWKYTRISYIPAIFFSVMPGSLKWTTAVAWRLFFVCRLLAVRNLRLHYTDTYRMAVEVTNILNHKSD